MVGVSETITEDERPACTCDEPEPIGFAGPARGSMLDPDPGPRLDELDWTYSCMRCRGVLPRWPLFLHNIFAAPSEPGPPYTHTVDLTPPDPAEAVAWLRGQIEIDHNRWRATFAQVRPVDAGGITVLPGGFEALALWEDAQDHVADCEAKLAILDGHHILSRDDRSEDYDEFSVVSIGGANKDHGCVTCHYYGQGGVKGHGICWTVRTLASAYRHREGYARYWGEPVTHTITEGGK
jgi:hypothetical protein